VLAQDLVCIFVMSGEQEIAYVAQELGWDLDFVAIVIKHAQVRELLTVKQDVASLTPVGFAHAQQMSAVHADSFSCL